MKILIIHNSKENPGLAWINRLERQLACESVFIPRLDWKERFNIWWRKCAGKPGNLNPLFGDLASYHLIVLCFDACSKKIPEEIKSFLSRYRTNIKNIALVLLKTQPGYDVRMIYETESTSGMRPVIYVELSTCQGKQYGEERTREFVRKINEYILTR